MLIETRVDLVKIEFNVTPTHYITLAEHEFKNQMDYNNWNLNKLKYISIFVN